MAMPSSVTVEIEFTAGVWTDVTAYLDGDSSGSTKFGRNGRFGSIAPGTLTLTLDNTDGRFTPGRQVLADGATAHPYYPNVLPRKRIRVAAVVGGTPLYRFTGYIKGWPPSMVNGETARVTINATTRDDQLSRVNLPNALAAEILADAAARYWPLTDGGDTGIAVEATGNAPLTQLVWGNGAAPTFGAEGPGSGNGTAVQFAPDGSLSGGLFNATALSTLGVRLPASNLTLEAWFNAGTTAPLAPEYIVFLSDLADSPLLCAIGVLDTGQVAAAIGQPGVAAVMTSPGSVIDGQYHHVAATFSSGGAVKLYLDGALVGSGTTPAVSTTFRQVIVGSYDENLDSSARPFVGLIGQVAVYASVLSASRIAVHNTAGRGWLGETVDARISRFLGMAGLTAADWTLDASAVTLGSYAQAGQDVVTACQDMATSEGGGAAFYVGTDGKVQFRNRDFRKPGAPALTLDNEADLDGQTFAPAFDDTQIVNQVQGNRATASGTASTQTVNDSASENTYGLASSSFTSYAASDDDVLYNAQEQLAQQRQPGYQLGQVALDLATATSPGLYAAVAAVDIGDRIRISNLPPGVAPATTVDLYVEGWADSFAKDEYTVVFDTSPADNPPWEIWDDASYGRWQADGNTLNASITAAATTLAIATAAGKSTFSTSAGSYPLTIAVGAEHIRLNSPPGGAISPQTFTGVTRGVDGTAAAAQAAGAAVDLAPASTWTL